LDKSVEETKMKTTLALVLVAFALSLCNLMGRRANTNSNSNSNINAGRTTESNVNDNANNSNNSNSARQEVKPQEVKPQERVTIVGAGSGTNSGPVRMDEPPPPPPSPKVPRAPISGGVLNGKAIKLVQPAYPAIARSAHASGQVRVQIVIDENGNVISATPVSGHPLLQAAAAAAARQSKFSPTKLSGMPVKVSGVLVYNFVAQ
jgi:TonB family protein